METRRAHSLPRGLFPALATLALLAIPLVAMQYTSEVQWDPADFLIMGVLLLGTGLAVEWAIRLKGSLALRAAWTLALLSTFLMTWANMAVGLLGGESNPLNMLLLSVPAAGVTGAALARLQPRGMALTLLAMAALQLALSAIAFSQGWRPLRQGPVDIWGPNGFFALLFAVSALLFWSATKVNRLLHGVMVGSLGVVIAAAGVAVGQADDAPGAGVAGIVIMAGLIALGVRLATRKS